MTLPGGVLPINMENPRYGGTYRAMSSQATASFDVAAVSTGGTNYTLNTVYEKLFRFEGSFTDRTTEVKPELAESFEALRGSADLHDPAEGRDPLAERRSRQRARVRLQRRRLHVRAVHGPGKHPLWLVRKQVESARDS